MQKTFLIFIMSLTLIFAPLKAKAFEPFPVDTFLGIVGSVGTWEEEWKILGMGMIGTFTLIAADREIYNLVQTCSNQLAKTITTMAGPLGSGTIAIPGLIGGYVLARRRNDMLLEQAVQEAWESFLISGLIVTIGKQFTHRHRPGYTEDPYQWEGPGFSTQNLSFPSGHSATAFSIATSFAATYGEKHPWTRFVAYSLAALAAFSRVHDSHHWASDVLAGSLIGWGVARQVRNFHQQKEEVGKWRLEVTGGVVLSREWTF